MNDFKRIIATILIVSLILNVNGILTLAQNLNNETSNTLETTETKIIEQLKNDLGETKASQILLNSENENLNNSENVIVDSEVEPGENLDEINNENENIDEPEEDEGDNKSFSEEEPEEDEEPKNKLIEEELEEDIAQDYESNDSDNESKNLNENNFESNSTSSKADDDSNTLVESELNIDTTEVASVSSIDIDNSTLDEFIENSISTFSNILNNDENEFSNIATINEASIIIEELNATISNANNLFGTTPHNHRICGKTSECDHHVDYTNFANTHTESYDWFALNNDNINDLSQDNIMCDRFYLTGDISINDSIVSIKQNINICLNGYNLTTSIPLNQITITNCKSNVSTITSSSIFTNGNIEVYGNLSNSNTNNIIISLSKNLVNTNNNSTQYFSNVDIEGNLNPSNSAYDMNHDVVRGNNKTAFENVNFTNLSNYRILINSSSGQGEYHFINTTFNCDGSGTNDGMFYANLNSILNFYGNNSFNDIDLNSKPLFGNKGLKITMNIKVGTTSFTRLTQVKPEESANVLPYRGILNIEENATLRLTNNDLGSNGIFFPKENSILGNLIIQGNKTTEDFGKILNLKYDGTQLNIGSGKIIIKDNINTHNGSGNPNKFAGIYVDDDNSVQSIISIATGKKINTENYFENICFENFADGTIIENFDSIVDTDDVNLVNSYSYIDMFKACANYSDADNTTPKYINYSTNDNKLKIEDNTEMITVIIRDKSNNELERYTLQVGSKITLSPFLMALNIDGYYRDHIVNSDDYSNLWNFDNDRVILNNTEQTLYLYAKYITLTSHYHSICGNQNRCSHHYDDLGDSHYMITNWLPLTPDMSFPTTDAAVYLVGDYVLTERPHITSNINLCLNGYKLIINEKAPYCSSTENYKIRITNCNNNISYIEQNYNYNNKYSFLSKQTEIYGINKNIVINTHQLATIRNDNNAYFYNCKFKVNGIQDRALIFQIQNNNDGKVTFENCLLDLSGSTVPFSMNNPTINFIDTEIKGYSNNEGLSLLGNGTHNFYEICTISNCDLRSENNDLLGSILNGNNIIKDGGTLTITKNNVDKIFNQEYINNTNIEIEEGSTLRIEDNNIERINRNDWQSILSINQSTDFNLNGNLIINNNKFINSNSANSNLSAIYIDYTDANNFGRINIGNGYIKVFGNKVYSDTGNSESINEHCYQLYSKNTQNSIFTQQTNTNFNDETRIDGVAFSSTTGTGIIFQDNSTNINSFTADTYNESNPSSPRGLEVGLNRSGNSILICEKYKKYNVSFDLNGGTGTGNYQDMTNLQAGVSYPLPQENPTKTYYEFVCWCSTTSFTDYENYQDSKICYADSITLYDYDLQSDNTTLNLYAIYQPIAYTIYYNTDGGEILDDDGNVISNPNFIKTYSIPYGLNLATPSKLGYTFAGWYRKQGNEFSIPYDKTNDDILESGEYTSNEYIIKAKWTPNKYKIEFDVDDHAYQVNPKYKTLDSPIDLPEPVQNENNSNHRGYIFDGWYEDQDYNKRYSGDTDLANVGSDETNTVYAKWKVKISFDMRGHGTPQPEKQIELNSEIGDELPTVQNDSSGYSFRGWYDNEYFTGSRLNGSYRVNAPKTLYAKWTLNDYFIHFNSDVPINDIPNKVKTFGVNLPTGTLPVPTGYNEQDYIFDGWFTDDGVHYLGNTDYLDGTQTLELYAKWKVRVSFNMKGHGTPPDEFSLNNYLNKDTEFNLSSPSDVTGYTFGGWYTDAGCTESNEINGSHNVDKPITLFAKWNPIEYVIIFDRNGGFIDADEYPNVELDDNDNQVISKTYGSGIENDIAIPDKAGYRFLGWFIKEGGELTVPFNSSNDEIYQTGETKHRVFAKWSANTYTIRYNLNGVNAVAPEPISKTYEIDINPNEIKKPTNIPNGYEFKGWYKDVNLQNEWSDGSDLSSYNGAQVDIYAKWEIEISFNAKGHGTAPEKQKILKNCTLNSLPDFANVVVEGYTFSGWKKNQNLSGPNVTQNDQFTEPTTLYAKWNENVYKVKIHYVSSDEFIDTDSNFSYDDTLACLTADKNYSEILLLPNNSEFTKEGYNFGGFWSSDGTGTNGWGTKITSIEANKNQDTDVYVKWIDKTYNITYIKNGGEWKYSSYQDTTTRKYSECTTLRTDDDIMRTGYRFFGWYEQSNYSGRAVTEVDENTDAHKTFYAKWTPETYKVTLYENEGTINEVNITSYTYGIGATLPTNVTKANSVFKGWWLKDGTNGDWGTQKTLIGSTESGNIVCYAKWAPKVEINFDFTHGTNPDYSEISNKPNNTSLAIGDNLLTIKPTINPSATNYKFLGWVNEHGNQFNFNQNITNNITIYAKWEEAEGNTKEFNFILRPTDAEISPSDGYTINNIPAQYVAVGDYVTEPLKPEALGYKFIAWYKNNDSTTHEYSDIFDFGTEVTTSFDATNSLYAKWDYESYNITYVKNGGEWSGNQTDTVARKYNESLTLPIGGDSNPEITKTGWTFDGWYTSETFDNDTEIEIIDNTDANAKDFTVYAKWNRDDGTKTIYLYNDKPNGTMVVEKSFEESDNTKQIGNNIFTKFGFTFKQWEDLEGNVYTNALNIPDQNVLYATWTQNAVTPKPTPYYPSGGGSGGGGGGGGGGRAASALTNNALKTPANETNTNQITTLKLNVTKSIKNYLDSDKTNWVKDINSGSWKLEISHGTYATGGFYLMNNMVKLDGDITKISTDTYYFNSQGNMVTGWVQTSDNKWFFFENAKNGNEGKMALRWKKVDDKYYFFTKDGSMLVNDLTPDGFIVGADGAYIN